MKSSPKIIEIARNLRRKQTETEKILWKILRNRRFKELKFRRQHPIGRFIADFYCSKLNLIIELDGPIHDFKKQEEYDRLRERVLRENGLRVLRFKNEEVVNNVDKIFRRIENLTHIPSPCKGGGCRRRGEDRGFTFIEIVIVLAIIFIILTITMVSLGNFKEDQYLKNNVNEAVSLINQARSRTLSSEDFSQYGIHFESNRAVLFKGTSYVAGDSNNTILSLSDFIEISTISLDGGGPDLIFEKLNGKTDQPGSVIFRAKNDFSKTKTIIIRITGLVEVQ